ncbi:MAG: tetratricopeptide repeat protein [Deltaproteobacteria bacterium]
MVGRRWLGFGLGLWLSCSSAPLWAQDAESQAAEALFRQAKSLMGQGQYAEACEKFSASQSLEPGLGTLLYLGDCYEHAGRFASALSTFAEARQFAQSRNDAEREHLASVRSAALEPRVPRLELRVGSEPMPAGLQISLNGSPVEPGDLNRPLPRDAGSYELHLSAPGYQTFSSRIELHNGEARPALVKVPRLVSVSATEAGDESREASSGRGGTQRVLAWVVGATGLALGIGAGVFSVLAAGRNSDSKANCDPDQPNRCGPGGVNAREDAKDLASAGTLAGIAGAVGVAGGVVLYVSAPSASETGVPNAALLTLSVPLL